MLCPTVRSVLATGSSNVEVGILQSILFIAAGTDVDQHFVIICH